MTTIRDVAKLAGVSSATVSNVLNGTKKVSAERSARVYEAVRELQYQPDYIASSLKKERTQTIGVIVTTLSRIFFSQMIDGITAVASQNDYRLIYYASEGKISNEMKYVDMLANYKVDGILLYSVADAKKHSDYLRSLKDLHRGNKKIRVVSLVRDLTQYGICSVHVDNLYGGRIATEHLVRQGCKKIAFVSGPMSLEHMQDRFEGYQAVLREQGITFDKEMVFQGDYTPISGYRAAIHFLSEGIRFDGIFACNDEMALGVVRALKDAGKRIPEEVRIIGYDNTFVSSLTEPSISTINIPKSRMGSSAAQMLIDHLDGKDREVDSCRLPLDLMVRSSTDAQRHTVWDLDKW